MSVMVRTIKLLANRQLIFINILDLLQKSWIQQRSIIKTGDQVQPQSESPPSITIALGQDTKDFQGANDMLHGDTQLSQAAIIGAAYCV